MTNRDDKNKNIIKNKIFEKRNCNKKIFNKVAIFALLIVSFLSVFTNKANAFAFYDSADNIFAFDLVLRERANVDGDAILLGETVNFAGHVSGNIIAAGNKVNVAADGIRNAFIMTKEDITVKSDSRALYLMGNNIKVKGNTSSAYLIGKSVYINGEINGDLTVIASQIRFSNTTKVTGKLKIESPTEPEYPDGIESESITYKKVDENEKQESLTAKLLRVSRFLLLLAPAGLITALIYIKLLGPFKRHGVKMLKKSPVKLFLAGVVMLVGMPAFSFIFMVALIGLPTAMIMLMIYLICFLLAVPCMGVAIGEMLFPEQSEYISGVVGTLINSILVAIPYIGVVIYIISLLYTYGMFYILMIELAKKETAKSKKGRQLNKDKGIINKIKKGSKKIKDISTQKSTIDEEEVNAEDDNDNEDKE